MTQQKRLTYIDELIAQKEQFVPGHRACIGCGEALAVRLVCKELGDNVIIANATGCMEIVSSQLPYTSWMVPWIHTLFDNTAAVASGIESGLKAMVRKGRSLLKDTKAIAMAGDGGTCDIGMQALSGALERGHNFIYFCFDNEAYMNTGIQRSSSTPYGAATSTSPAGRMSIGQITWKKNMPAIAAAHGVPYVATACPSHVRDLITKVRKAKAVKGPSYIHILSVCPTGWRCPPENAVSIGRLATETRIFPLYEIENGKYKVNVMTPQPKPVSEYLKLQGRFRHLSADNIKEIQQRVDAEYAKLVERAAQDAKQAAPAAAAGAAPQS